MVEKIEKICEEVEILDRRAFFVFKNGEIRRKKIVEILPVAVFCNDNVFDKALSLEKDKRERIKFKKIQRMSNLGIDKLESNFLKLVLNGELEFAKVYGKELALRDREIFFQILYKLVLMDNPYFYKGLMVLSFKEILNICGWKDEIWYLVVSYLTKQREETYIYENISYFDECTEKVEENLAVLVYRKILENYKGEDKERFKKCCNYYSTHIQDDRVIFRDELFIGIKERI